MRIIAHEKYGPPELLRLREVVTPEPGENEILVRIYATTVTSADVRVRALNVPSGFKILARLAFGVISPRQPVLGSEFSGVIESVGKNVYRFKKGDEVFGFTDTRMGCHTEYKCLPEDSMLLPKPSRLSFEEAAAISFSGTTALSFLRKSRLNAGEKLLVNGASGAVGMATVQLAKYFGAEVTGVCSRKNIDLVQALGADHVIDYTREDFSANRNSYDIIIDTVGNAPFPRVSGSLTPGGRLVMAVATLAETLMALWASPGSGRKVIAGPAVARLADLHLLGSLAERNIFKPVIDRGYPFDQFVDAHNYVDSGRKRGSVVLISHSSLARRLI